MASAGSSAGQRGPTQDVRGSAAVQAGIDAGNINLQSAGTTTLGLSESSLEAQARHAELLRKVEAERLARTVIVPTDPAEVISVLRSMGHPITLFGERVGDRRERLRLLLAQREIDGEAPLSSFSTGPASAEPQTGSTGPARTTVVHTHASPSLIEARVDIGKWSFEAAQARLAAQRGRANAPNAAALAKEEDTAVLETFKRLQTLQPAASLPGDARRTVAAVGFSPCGGALASASWSGEVKVWSRESLTATQSLRGHTERVVTLAWRPGAVVAPPPPVADDEGDVALEGGGADTAPPSGSAPVQLATGAADGCVKLWHAGQEEAVATLEGHRDRLARVAWHPAGRHLASTSFDYTWRLWDVEAQAELLVQDGHAREVYPVAFHPDGSLVATGDLGGIGRVWDLRSGKSVMTLKGHVTQLLALDMSPNGVNLATGSDDHTVNVWDLRAQRIVYSIAAHSRLISTVKFAPVSGAYLVTAAYDGLIRTWSARDWTAISVHRGHEDKITCVDIDPTEKHFVSSGFDKLIKVWEPEELDF